MPSWSGSWNHFGVLPPTGRTSLILPPLWHQYHYWYPATEVRVSNPFQNPPLIFPSNQLCWPLIHIKQNVTMLIIQFYKLWKTLKEMGIPDHLTCLLRNLYAGQEETFTTRHGTTDWFQIGKGACQGCILLPCLFNYMQSTTREMPGWMKHKLESSLPGETSIISVTQMISPLWQKVKRN